MYISALMAKFGALMSTFFLTNIIKNQVGGASSTLEQNPIMRVFLSSSYGPYLIPLFIISFYVIVTLLLYLPNRKQAMSSKLKINIMAFNFITFFIFFSLIIDFINDFGILIKLV